MKAIAILPIFILSICSYSQDNLQGLPGNKLIVGQNGDTRIITEPVAFNSGAVILTPAVKYFDILTDNNSAIRWSYFDAVAIGDKCQVSGNGLYEVIGWGLNDERVSIYNNVSSTPEWEFSTVHGQGYYYNNIAISDTGGVIALASFRNVYMFNRTNSTPFFNFDLTTLPPAGNATAIDITNDGKFIVTCSSLGGATDSSTVLGFSSDSTGIVWRYKVGQTTAGGSSIQGIKMSGNDSLVIVNTYGGFYVFRTYTGQLIFQGAINTNSSGTQSPQAISGNGNIIATINYSGFVKVYQWNGSTYNLLWQHQEPPGAFFNWMTSVDVSYDGSMVASGTLNFVTSSSFDGKLKFFRVTSGSTPVWTYTGMGDEVQSVSFSRNGNILVGSSWGNFNDPNTPNLLVFKTSTNSNVPIFRTASPGSFFCSSVSNNGLTALGSGKVVHARFFGSGGQSYNLLIDTNDSPLGISGNLNVPAEYKLYQNYPNPFNPATKIKFALPKGSFATLLVYDVLGREMETIVNEQLNAGTYEANWNAGNFSSGVYYYKVIAGDFVETKKMVLVK